VARVFGDAKADLRHRGELIEDANLLIASTALAYQLTVVTNNTRHFARISGLTIESWIVE
jgi:tRNA(fMet)-specific endonuclease VapC